MKEKKTILMMMFSVAFVALIIAVISAFFDSFYVMRGASGYRIMIGIFELITSIFGITFCVFYVLEFFINKKDWLIISQYVSAIVVIAFFILFAIVSRITVSLLPYASTSTFLSFLNVSLNIIITEMIVFVSSFYIKRITRKEQEEEKKALEQQPLE